MTVEKCLNILGADRKCSKALLREFAKDYELLRKNGAHIVWTILRDQYGEAEETNQEKLPTVAELRDLYDCRVCAADIMQVVAKGVMEPRPQVIGAHGSSIMLFGGELPFTEDEAELVAKRMRDSSLRVGREKE